MRVVPFVPAALAALVAVGGISDAAPRTHGKIVRIERQRSAAVIPRICEVRDSGEGACFGPEPKPGDVITVIGERSVMGQARITESAIFGRTGGATACVGLWDIHVEMIRGDLDNSMRGIGVVASDIHATKARVIPRDQVNPTTLGSAGPNGQTDTVQVAIDRDGDGVIDLFLSQSNCDPQHPEQASCLDEWSSVNGRFQRVFQTNFASCGL